MAEVILQAMGLIGAGEAPANLAELIPYLLTFFVGLVLICAVFKVLGSILHSLISARRM